MPLEAGSSAESISFLITWLSSQGGIQATEAHSQRGWRPARIDLASKKYDNLGRRVRPQLFEKLIDLHPQATFAPARSA